MKRLYDVKWLNVVLILFICGLMFTMLFLTNESNKQYTENKLEIQVVKEPLLEIILVVKSSPSKREGGSLC